MIFCTTPAFAPWTQLQALRARALDKAKRQLRPATGTPNGKRLISLGFVCGRRSLANRRARDACDCISSASRYSREVSLCGSRLHVGQVGKTKKLCQCCYENWIIAGVKRSKYRCIGRKLCECHELLQVLLGLGVARCDSDEAPADGVRGLATVANGCKSMAPSALLSVAVREER